MAPLSGLVRIWRAPGAAITARLAQGGGEPAALARLMGGCLAAFLSTWPALMRAASGGPPPLEARLGGALFGWLFLAPLAFYALAAVSHLAARALGGRGSWAGARLALFSALFAVWPLMLLHGVLMGIAPGSAPRVLVAAALAGGFLYIWGRGLIAAESPGRARGE